MFQLIISNTPLYVWLLLSYLLYSGWKARKTYVISWKTLFIMPVILLIWSIYSRLYNYTMISFYLWVLSIIIGIFLGLLTVRLYKMSFDKKKKLIQIEGNWIPLILSLSIFSLRYFLGVMYGFRPELRESFFLLGIENLATIISGMFLGRLIGYFKRSRISEQTDLIKL